MSNNDKEQEKIKENNTNDDILENSNKIIEKAKELALIGIPRECQSCAKNFFDCIHEELKPFDSSGRIYTSQELEDILENEVIPKCKRKYDLDKCLEQNKINKNEEEISEEEEEEEEEELKL